jgi:hypothetical protein
MKETLIGGIYEKTLDLKAFAWISNSECCVKHGFLTVNV